MATFSSSSKCGVRYIGNCGLKVSNLCLGALTFGSTEGAMIHLPGQSDEAASHAILDKFVEMGGNFIDTADIYSAGRSESIVGSWLQKQAREQIVIATKVRFPMGAGPNDVGLSRKHILSAVEESLKRLNTSYIDHQTHAWDDGTPIEETLSTLTDLVRQGKVRYLGLSNVTGWQLQKIIDLTKYKHYEPFVSLQVQYNLMCRETEWELGEVCKREGLGILPWSPLKTGWLTGKVTRSGAPEGSRVEHHGKDDTTKPPYFRDYAKEEQTWQILDVLKAVAEELGKSIPQVALKWLLHQETVSSVVIGAKKMEQLVDNMGAGDDSWKLTADQLKRLGDVSDIMPLYPYSMIDAVQVQRRRNGLLVL
ncbi:1-deoxyxylulose-5-phosphate synthase YajO-like [Corticium candelabrum]|uniref:1-deoxyxylulose-5-phosphate synthase YajO-like n=1 Tax=Corticium candelabrum TaxID=121492 RepID=UPI002E268B39|nr:1-deoxyxylulose-5-phosphate synthase YajO-like [Corticium candelabrum]